jgi:hypothetical protein
MGSRSLQQPRSLRPEGIVLRALAVAFVLHCLTARCEADTGISGSRNFGARLGNSKSPSPQIPKSLPRVAAASSGEQVEADWHCQDGCRLAEIREPGLVRCAEVVYKSQCDSDYQAVLRLVEAAVEKEWTSPRRDVRTLSRREVVAGPAPPNRMKR